MVYVEDTFAEAFDGIFCRVIVTAPNGKVLKEAALSSTALPSAVVGRLEAGVESWLPPGKTPDGRAGAILQFWGLLEDGKPLEQILAKFEKELSYRVRQGILVKPFTRVFDASANPLGYLDMMNRVGHCGDGYEWVESRYGREMITVPTMVPDFQIERRLGYSIGVMGANLWYMCSNKGAVLRAGRRILEAIKSTEGVITPFDICSAGSKPETKFPWIGPTTNHPFCPSLKRKLRSESRVPEGVRYIPEIVINGTSLEAVKEAMRRGVLSAREVAGVVRISAGNYGGKLGRYMISLRELIHEV